MFMIFAFKTHQPLDPLPIEKNKQTRITDITKQPPSVVVKKVVAILGSQIIVHELVTLR
jgi:hypothetical protein